MSQPNIIVKAAVVASSLLLAAGFVFYRAGALSGPTKWGAGSNAIAATLSAHPDSPDVGSGVGKEPPPDSTPQGRRFMGSSKSLAPLIEPSADTSSTGSSNRPRSGRFMGGSKSLAPLIEPPASDSSEGSHADSGVSSKREP
jgi:hypothetical protein